MLHLGWSWSYSWSTSALESPVLQSYCTSSNILGHSQLHGFSGRKCGTSAAWPWNSIQNLASHAEHKNVILYCYKQVSNLHFVLLTQFLINLGLGLAINLYIPSKFMPIFKAFCLRVWTKHGCRRLPAAAVSNVSNSQGANIILWLGQMEIIIYWISMSPISLYSGSGQLPIQ